ncbi:hypothetical protein QRC94_004712 [Vibrio vulnificus]|nr:hypothetical protein [Vibrio vulnificus]EJC6822249.1 hypothetical protein [Vibrio vulnificus]EJC6955927.1 hypothetical protein [Vibrio vulnificus]EJC6960405.1 hypothetical protein [Vibrio vulnificus]EKQ3696949.1 hypothetical protein [Vibrio vulnificus]
MDLQGQIIKSTHVFFRAGFLYKIALEASKKVENEPEQALVSLIFSYNSLEAFINETATSCEIFSGGRRTDKERDFYYLINQMQDNRESTAEKYHKAKEHFTGERWDKGGKVFQNFALLTSLRNELIHRKSEVVKQEKVIGGEKSEIDLCSIRKKLYSRLIDKKLVTNIDPTAYESWIDSVQNPRFAKWCCETALNMTTEFFSYLPEGHFKNRMMEQMSFQADENG